MLGLAYSTDCIISSAQQFAFAYPRTHGVTIAIQPTNRSTEIEHHNPPPDYYTLGNQDLETGGELKHHLLPRCSVHRV